MGATRVATTFTEEESNNYSCPSGVEDTLKIKNRLQRVNLTNPFHKIANLSNLVFVEGGKLVACVSCRLRYLAAFSTKNRGYSHLFSPMGTTSPTHITFLAPLNHVNTWICQGRNAWICVFKIR